MPALISSAVPRPVAVGRGLLAIGLSALAIGLAPAAASAATLDTVYQPSPMASENGRTVWSRYNPSTGNYSLMTESQGTISQVSVPPRDDGPFDVDLGPNEDGELVAVYSRCSADEGTGPTGFSYPTSQSRCNVYSHNFDNASKNRSRGQTKLTAPSSAAASEFDPTVWRSKIAFARISSARGGQVRILAGELDGHGGYRELKPGPRGRDGGRLGGLDLRGRRLAYSWQEQERRGPVRSVRITTLGGTRTVYETANPSDTRVTTFTAPAYDDAALTYSVRRETENRDFAVLRRREVTGGGSQTTDPLDRVPADVSTDGPNVGLSDAGPCTTSNSDTDPTLATPNCRIRVVPTPPFTSAATP